MGGKAGGVGQQHLNESTTDGTHSQLLEAPSSSAPPLQEGLSVCACGWVEEGAHSPYSGLMVKW